MTPKQKNFAHTAFSIIEQLKKRQMEGYYCPTAAEAVEKALSLMPEGASVAWGGSMTLTESGMMDALRSHNYQLIDRDTAKTPEEKKEIFARTVCADYYFMSTNAITMDGQLVNVDGFANRVACLCAGPEHVMIFAGRNKIVPDVDSAIKRTRNLAAPANTVRLNKNTPCASKGKCFDCLSADCICSQTVITRRSQIPGRIQVFLIDEELGY